MCPRAPFLLCSCLDASYPSLLVACSFGLLLFVVPAACDLRLVHFLSLVACYLLRNWKFEIHHWFWKNQDSLSYFRPNISFKRERHSNRKGCHNLLMVVVLVEGKRSLGWTAIRDLECFPTDVWRRSHNTLKFWLVLMTITPSRLKYWYFGNDWKTKNTAWHSYYHYHFYASSLHVKSCRVQIIKKIVRKFNVDFYSSITQLYWLFIYCMAYSYADILNIQETLNWFIEFQRCHV
jgi:hypothetical protein